MLAALRLYLRDATHALHAGALAVAEALDALAARDGSIALPGYTHMQQAMPSTVALWASDLRRRDSRRCGGFAARAAARGQESARFRRRLRHAEPRYQPRIDAPRLGFAVTHEPVTAVQLSRGKAEAQLLFEITLLTQDIGRLAADLLLFYTQEFGFVSLPDEFTTGSSIMPQKRNPDVFELMRGRSAVAQAALNEVLGITQKLTSGYQRDLQLIKPPLFRAIDSCRQTLDILPAALAGVRFRPEHIRLDPEHSCRGGGERVGGQGEHSVSRGLSAGGRHSQGDQMSIWRSARSARGAQRRTRGTMMRPLGIVFTEVGEDFIRAAMPVDERTRQPYGLLHGGASVALAETWAARAPTCASIVAFPLRRPGDQRQSRALGPHGRVIGTARPCTSAAAARFGASRSPTRPAQLVCVSRLTMAVLERAHPPGHRPL